MRKRCVSSDSARSSSPRCRPHRPRGSTSPTATGTDTRWRSGPCIPRVANARRESREREARSSTTDTVGSLAHPIAPPMPTCAFLSFRLGSTDGVSIVAGRWIEAFAVVGLRREDRRRRGAGRSTWSPVWPSGADHTTGRDGARRCLGGRRSGRRREPAHDPDEPTGLTRRRSGSAGPSRLAAPPRPAVAAGPVRAHHRATRSMIRLGATSPSTI